jgi:hypothetical protein
VGPDLVEPERDAAPGEPVEREPPLHEARVAPSPARRRRAWNGQSPMPMKSWWTTMRAAPLRSQNSTARITASNSAPTLPAWRTAGSVTLPEMRCWHRLRPLRHRITAAACPRHGEHYRGTEGWEGFGPLDRARSGA